MRTQFFLHLLIAAGSVWFFISSFSANINVRIPIVVCMFFVMCLCFNLVRLAFKELKKSLGLW